MDKIKWKKIHLVPKNAEPKVAFDAMDYVKYLGDLDTKIVYASATAFKISWNN